MAWARDLGLDGEHVQRGEGQGGMEGSQELHQPLAADGGWWTLPDESYWQALLRARGVCTRNSAASRLSRGFSFPGRRSRLTRPQLRPPTAMEATAQIGKGCGQQAHACLDQGELFELQVAGANRGGLLVEWQGHARVRSGVSPARDAAPPRFARPGRRAVTAHRRFVDRAPHRSGRGTEPPGLFRAGSPGQLSPAGSDPGSPANRGTFARDGSPT